MLRWIVGQERGSLHNLERFDFQHDLDIDFHVHVDLNGNCYFDVDLDIDLREQPFEHRDDAQQGELAGPHLVSRHGLHLEYRHGLLLAPHGYQVAL